TSSESGSSRSLFSALAMALASTLYTCSLAACGANLSTVSASFAGSPRTRFTTRRALLGAMRTWRAMARAPGSAAVSLFVGILDPSRFMTCLVGCPRAMRAARLAAAGLAVVLLVTLERAGQRKLAELVPDHRLGDEHRHVLASVVHGDRVPEHVRHDHRTPRP